MSQMICQNLSVGYEGKVVYENINFSVEQGDYLCIIGENGAGKTTLMRTILDLQKPLNGVVQWEKYWKKAEIGYLPQQTQVQKDFPASVREIVLSGCQNRCSWHPFYSREQKKHAQDVMEKLHLLSMQKECYRELSGGQQQRVLLARAMCATRKMLLLDEPIAGLDHDTTTEMYHLIRSINQNEHITVLMISHDIPAALTDATHVLYLGKNFFYGTKEAFLEKGGMEHGYI